MSQVGTLVARIGLTKARRRRKDESFPTSKSFLGLKSSTMEDPVLRLGATSNYLGKTQIDQEGKSVFTNVGKYKTIKELERMPRPNKQSEELTSAKAKINLKLLVDKTKNKVLFAEGGKECVDFLFHILSLPLGTVAGYLNKASMVGSIGSLYRSLESLSDEYLIDGLSKDRLLEPKPGAGSALIVPHLSIEPAPDEPGPNIFYTCANSNYTTYYNNVHPYVSATKGAKCPQCQQEMNVKLTCVEEEKAKEKSNVGGYVKGVVTYMIMDDLSVEPMSTISGITLMNRFNVLDVGGLEGRSVSLDMEKGIALLKASLMSKTVLTDVFLRKKEVVRQWH